jgi:hypothetical protein
VLSSKVVPEENRYLEEQAGMKKSGLLLVLALCAGAFYALPASTYAQAQQQAQPQFKSDAERLAYEEYYNAAYREKNKAKAYDLARAFLEKFPQSEYIKYVESTVINTLGERFQEALNNYYQGAGGPDAAKLDQLIKAGEDYLQRQPGQVYVSAQLALASSRGVLAGFYKDPGRAKSYAEKALTLMESETPPKDYPREQYLPLRENVIAQSNQYLGYYELQQPTPNTEAAITYLTKATSIRNKDGLGWKDVNNYWLRASAHQKQYQKLSAEYSALPDEQKTGEAGKALLERINPLIDKMIDDYARTVAAAGTKPEAKPLRDAAKEALDSFWKYRYSNLPGGQDQLVKQFEADPTIAAPARTPAASSTGSAPSAPTGATGSPALSSAPAMGATGSKNGSKNGSKPAKGKPATRKRRG